MDVLLSTPVRVTAVISQDSDGFSLVRVVVDAAN